MAEGTVNILYNWVSQGFDAVNAAIELANSGTKSLTGALSNLGSISKTVGLNFIDMGTTAISSIVSMTDSLFSLIEYVKNLGTVQAAATSVLAVDTVAKTANTAATGGNIAAEAISNTMKMSSIGVTTGAAAATTGFSLATWAATAATTVLTIAMSLLNVSMLPIYAIILGLVAIAYIFKAAWEANFLGIADIVDDTIGFVMDLFDDLFGGMVNFFDAADEGVAIFDILRLAILPITWPLELSAYLFGLISEKIEAAGGIMKVFAGPIKFVSDLVNLLSTGLEFLFSVASKIIEPFKVLGEILGILIAPLQFVMDAVGAVGDAVGGDMGTAAGGEDFGAAASNTYVGGSSSNKNNNFNTTINGATPQNAMSLSDQYLGIVTPQLENMS